MSSSNNFYLNLESSWPISRRVVGPLLKESSIRLHIDLIDDVILETFKLFPSEMYPFDILHPFSTCNFTIFMRLLIGKPLDEDIVKEYIKRYHRYICEVFNSFLSLRGKVIYLFSKNIWEIQ